MEELRLLKEAYIIKTFKCNLGNDIFAVMMMHEYCAEFKTKIDENGTYRKYSDWIHNCKNYSVFRSALETGLVGNEQESSSSNDSNGEAVANLRFSADEIQLLLRDGYLIPRRDCNTGAGSSVLGEIFWFSHPRINKHCQLLLSGRDMLVKAVKKSKFKEICVGKLLKLTNCGVWRNGPSVSVGVGNKRKRDVDIICLPLGFKYHIYDLLGCRVLEYADNGLNIRDDASILRLTK